MKKLLCVLALVLMTVASCSKEEVGGGNDEPQKQPEITIGTTSSDFSTEGGSKKISFTSSGAWTAEAINTRAASWCSVNPTSGPAGSCEISISVTANDTPDNRTASVVIKSGSISKTISVSQKQKDALTVTSSKFEVGSEGGEVKIEVKANIDFEYLIEETAKSWVKYVETKAMKTSSLIFDIEKNEDLQKREAKIYIKSGSFNDTISIYQAGEKPSIVISKNEYTVTSAGGAISVEVASNVNVAVEMPTGVDWITEDATKAMSTNTYNFKVAPNEGYNSREAKVKFVNKENGLVDSVRVVQMQKDVIVLAQGSYNVDSEGGQIQIVVGHNVDFGIEISCDWITKIDTRAFVKDTLMFSVAENTTSGDREGEITFSSGDIVQKVKVIQSSLSGRQIKYKSSDGNIVVPKYTGGFGASIVSNEYKNGVGVITFDKKVTVIGNSTFKECKNLTYIELPKTIYSIESEAFYGCIGLTTLSLSNSLTRIGYAAFHRCIGLTTLSLPEGLQIIGREAFSRCTSLTELTLPNSITSIGDFAFTRCTSLTELTLPNSVKSIGSGAFEGCTGLTELTLPSVTSIGISAFEGCTGLTALTLPSVKSIGTSAFKGCTGLTTLTLPEGLKEIDSFVFSGCTGLTALTLPNSVTSIEMYAFEGCTGLTALTLSNSLTSIGDLAFRGCAGLTTLTLPNSLTSIGSGAFGGCTGLTTLTLPNSVTSIGSGAFGGCTGLTALTLSNSLTSIGSSAFRGCTGLTTLTLPSRVTSIGDFAFAECTGLTSVYFKLRTPPSIGIEIFYRVYKDLKIYVPSSSLAAYKSALSDYSSKIYPYTFED